MENIESNLKKLNYKPGIFSARWAGQSRNFDLGTKKIFEKMNSSEKYVEQFKSLPNPPSELVELLRSEGLL